MLLNEIQIKIFFIFLKFILNFDLADWSLLCTVQYIRKVVNLAIETEMSVQTIPHSSLIIKCTSTVEQEL